MTRSTSRPDSPDEEPRSPARRRDPCRRSVSPDPGRLRWRGSSARDVDRLAHAERHGIEPVGRPHVGGLGTSRLRRRRGA